MNNQVLRKRKIDVQYVLSEKKFLYTFGYLCLGRDFVEKKSWKKRDLRYILERNLIQVPEEMVTYENVARGEVLLVGRPDSFRAYLRPKEKLPEKITEVSKISITKKSEEDKKEICDYTLTELLEAYHDTFEQKESQICLDELISRLHNLGQDKVEMQTGYMKTYHKKVLTKDKKVIK